jgi:hypothetical protein
MRVFRTILGMLLLTTGLPALLAGGGLWAVMQHRDPGGAFSGELQRLTVPGYAVVVPDIDQLLRDDVPFARIADTQLRLSAVTVDGRAFLGLAPSDEVARYLTGVPFSQIDGIDIGTGALPVTTTRTGGRQAPAGPPGRQGFWTATGAGQISIDPGELRDRPYSLVLMNPGGGPVMRIAAIAEIRPGWLNPSTWGLLTLGTLLVMLGVTVLVWPGRRREIVYVVEPSQVPDLMHAIGAPLPLPGGVAYFAGARSGGAHRPRTLADSRPRPPALPQFAWPPNAPELPSGRAVPLNAATLTHPISGGTPTDTTDDDAPTGPASAYLAATLAHAAEITPTSPPAEQTSAGSPGPAGSPGSPGLAGSPGSAAPPGSAGSAVATASAGSATASAGSATASAGSATASAGSATASAGSGGSRAGSADGRTTSSVAGFAAGSAFTGGSAGAHTPAPGKPLSLLGETPALAGLQPGAVPARRGERRTNTSDLPQFQATAVGAWVAATAPERARQTEARAAARLAEAAARRNAGKFAPTQPGNRNTSANARIPIAAPRRDNGEIPAPAQPTQAPAQPDTLETGAHRCLSDAEAAVPDSGKATPAPTGPATKPAATDATAQPDLTDSATKADTRRPTDSATEADASTPTESATEVDASRSTGFTTEAGASKAAESATEVDATGLTESTGQAGAAEAATRVAAGKPVAAEVTEKRNAAATSVANPADETTTEPAFQEKKARQEKARRAGSASASVDATPDAVRQNGSKPTAVSSDADSGAAVPGVSDGTASAVPGGSPSVVPGGTVPGVSDGTASAVPGGSPSVVPGGTAPVVSDGIVAAGPGAVAVEPAPEQPAPARPVVSRIALRTGPAATDWIATGITEIGPSPAPRPSPRPSPKPAAANRSASPDRPVESGRHEIAEAAEVATGPVSNADGSAPEQPAEQSPPRKPSVPETVTGATSSPPEWPLISRPAGSLAARGETGSEPMAVEDETAAVQGAAGSGPGRQPIVPLPARTASPGSAGRSEGRSTGSAPTGSTAVARPAGSRASMHAAETGSPGPALSRPGPADVRGASDDRTGARDEQPAAAAERAATPREPSTITGHRPLPATSDQTRTLPRPGRDRRSVHTVEADGLGVLPKKPAPVPTQGTPAAAQTPASNAKQEPIARKPVATEKPAATGEPDVAGKPPTFDGPVVDGTSSIVDGPVAEGASSLVDGPTAAAILVAREPVPEAKSLNGETAGTSAANSVAVEADTTGTSAAESRATGEQAPTGSRQPASETAGAKNISRGTSEPEGLASRDKTGRARKTAGRKSGDDQPLARAQGRASGKATTARPAPAPATRRVPAAWIKAAESMAARTGQSGPTTTPVVPEKPTTTGTPEPTRERAATTGTPGPVGKTAATEDVAGPVGKTAATGGVAGPVGKTAVTGSVAGPVGMTAPTTGAPGPVGKTGVTGGVAVPVGKTGTTGSVAEPAGDRGAIASAPEPAGEGSATTGTPKVAGGSGTTTGVVEPAGQTVPQGRVGDETARPLSYREEAAELLGGGERRRRRTVAGRNRPKTDPSGDDNGRPKTGR